MKARTRPSIALAFLAVALAASGARAAAPEPPGDELRRIVREAVSENDSFRDRFDAEVWLTDMSRRLREQVPERGERLRLLKQIHYEATRADLPPELVLAVIEVESDFNQWAISSAGAQGLMQIMPFWLDEIGEPGDNLFHVQTNLRMGCTILRYYWDQAGDLTAALARYNGSVGQRWYPERVFDALTERWYRQ